MTNKIQININTVFTDFIDAYFNGQDITAEQLNIPLVQLGLNTGWLKLKIQELESSKENAFIKRTGFNRDFGTTAGTVVEGNDPRLSDARAPKPHSHELSQLTLPSNTVSGFIFNNGGVLEIRQSSGGASTWNDISGKPLVFPSNINNVDGLNAALSGKAAASHTHTPSQITGLDSALNGKANVTHTHTVDNVTGLRSELDSKSPTSHTHVIENISNLRNELNARAGTLHSHQISDIDGLAAYLDGLKPVVVKQVFTSTGSSNYTLTNSGQVFKVTLNGLDLDDGEWSQSSSTLTVSGSTSGDKVIAYTNDSSGGSVGRYKFSATTNGTNNFTLPSSKTAWQVTLNGLDLDEYTQSGATISISSISSGDVVIIYTNP